MTTPEALKALYVALGGSSSNVAGLSKTVDVLNKISALYGGSGGGNTIPKAIASITAVASGVVKPSGTKNITANGTNIDVAEYAKVTVAVPASAVVSGNKEITANGTDIDVTNYATVSVNVTTG